MAKTVWQYAVRCAWQRTLDRAVDQEAGYTLVEFALMVLLMFTFGMLDLGRAVYAANVVQAAAQMGARAGLVDIATAVPAVQNQLTGLDASRVQITVSLLSNERVEVEVNYAFEFITPYLSQLVTSGTLKLTDSASMIRY
jgi:Flp pilus assembly protein TadG